MKERTPNQKSILTDASTMRLRAGSGCANILGILFLSLSGLIFWKWASAVDLAGRDAFLFYGMPVFFVVFGWVGLRFLVSYSVTIDLSSRQLTTELRLVFPFRRRHIPLMQVQGLHLLMLYPQEFFRLEFRIKDGGAVLLPLGSHDFGETLRAARQVAAFTQLPIVDESTQPTTLIDHHYRGSLVERLRDLPDIEKTPVAPKEMKSQLDESSERLTILLNPAGYLAIPGVRRSSPVERLVLEPHRLVLFQKGEPLEMPHSGLIDIAFDGQWQQSLIIKSEKGLFFCGRELSQEEMKFLKSKMTAFLNAVEKRPSAS